MGKEHALPDTAQAIIDDIAADLDVCTGCCDHERVVLRPENIVSKMLRADRQALAEAGFALVENVNVTPDFFENLCSSPLGLRIWFESHNYPFTVRGEP